MKRLVACTSTGCIEYAPERYHNLGIDIIRVHLFFKGKEYLEGLDLDPDKFYKELETLENPKNNLPYTAMPTVKELQDFYDSVIARGYDEVIIVSISSGLGGTYNLIKHVGKDYENRLKISVIDARITCFNEGYLAVKISEFVKQGMPTEKILEEVEWIKAHQHLVGVDGKLDYLIYNGRLKGGKALIGKMMQICPLIHFNKEGEVATLQTVRTAKKALRASCEKIKELIGDRSPEDYLLWHVYTGRSLIDELIELEKEYGITCNHEDVIMSPVSGCHNGPWLAGYCLVFIRKEGEI